MKSSTLRSTAGGVGINIHHKLGNICRNRSWYGTAIALAAFALLACARTSHLCAQSQSIGPYAEPYSYTLPVSVQPPSTQGPASQPAANPSAAPDWAIAPERLGADYYGISEGQSPGTQSTAPTYDQAPRRRIFENTNLTVDLPGGPWHEIASPIATSATTSVVVVAQGDPDLAVVIIGEKIGVELNLSPETLLQTSQSMVRMRLPGLTFANNQPLAVGPIAGTRFEAHGSSAQGNQVYGVMWSGQSNGYLYHVLCFGEAHQQGAVEAAHRLFRERMSVIDPTRVAHTDANKLASKFESTNFGYDVDLENMGWLRGDSADLNVPGTEFIANCGQLSLLVLPVPLPGRTVDEETLAKVFLDRMGFTYPSQEIRAVGPYQLGALRGQRYEGQRALGASTLLYRVRLVASDRAAYMFLGVALDGDAASIERLEEALDRVALTNRPLPNEPQMSLENQNGCGLLLNSIGLLSYQRGDLAGALDFFAGAYRLHPADNAILSNYVETLTELGRTADALGVLEQHMVKYPANPDVRATQAKLLGISGQSEAARRLYTELFAAGYADEGALGEFLELATEDKAYDEAIQAVRLFALRRPTIDVQLTLATLYGEKGDYNTAIAQLLELSEQNPNNLDVAHRLARVLGDAERYDEALAITQRLIDSGQRGEVTLLLHGKHQLSAERYAEAKQTFEQAVQLHPHSEIAKELVKIAANQLGQGDNSALTTPIAAVEFPEAVRIAIQQAPVQAAKSLEKYGAEEQVRIVGVSFHRNQPLRTTVSRRIKIHTAGGVSQYNTLTFELNPMVERFYVNRLVVLDTTGKQVAEGSVDTYYVVDDSSTGVASNAKLVTVPVPGLKPGYSIECMVTREDRAPSEEFGFGEINLSTSVPVGVSAYYIEGDVQSLNYKTSVPLNVEVGANLLQCVTANPPAYRAESKQQPIERFLPIVWIGEAGSTWEAETHEYLKMVAGKLALEESTIQLATELTKGCTTNREKLAVLAEYTQGACTYHAIEFGRRARVPNSAAQTLSLHYGDCKDHALLLKQLLAGVGIPSELTVVNSSQRITPELPSLDQFDHMVLFVPGEAVGQPPNEIGGLIVDATQKCADPLLYPPYGMADKSFLVLDAARPRRRPHTGLSARRTTANQSAPRCRPRECESAGPGRTRRRRAIDV